MAATATNKTSPPLTLPPKLNALTNGSSPLPEHMNSNKKLPPIPTKPKPPLSHQRSSHLCQRVSADSRLDTDSSPDTSPRPVLKSVPFTKKLSLDSFIPTSTNLAPMLPPLAPLSPTRSDSNLSHLPPPVLKPKPTQTTPSSSPLPFRRISTDVPPQTHRPRTDSPVVAPKPLFPLAHKLPHSSATPHTTCDTASEDSGIFISPDKMLPELPPKLPVRLQKSQPEKNNLVTCNIIVVPKIEPRKQRWTTNTSDLAPPLPDKLLCPDDKARSSSEADTLEGRSKIYRTLPSRGTKKKRPNLLHHTDISSVKPCTPPPVCKSQMIRPIDSLNSNALHIPGRFERSHSFDSLDSLGSGNSHESAARNSDANNGHNSRKKSTASIASTVQEAKKGKMKRALLKALGVNRKDSNSEIEPMNSLPVSMSNPALNTPILNSVQSVPAKVSRALNMANMGLSKDDSFVFENVSDTETDSRAEIAKLSYESAKPRNQLPTDTSSTSSPMRHKHSRSPSKRSLNAQQPPTSPRFQYTDFPYVFENAESDSDSLSDVEAFDDFDDILNDSDNEMTEEDVKKAKLRTMARAASGVTSSKCYYVAKELLSTEETYVRKLELLHVEFSQALEEAGTRIGKAIVPDDTLKKIFSNLPELYQINSAFRDELKMRLDTWSKLSPKDQNIGDIMKKHTHFFKAYSPFISNFDNALKMLDELSRKNSNFCSFLSSFQSLPMCGSLPISAHLLGIVQRIPRYKLLLEQYIKHLPEESGDREDSEKALTLITEVAIHVNENLRMMDNFNKMIEVLNKIDGDLDNLLVPSRQFIKGGELKKVCRKGLQVRAFFLFTDLLLHTSLPGPGSSNYSLHTRIPLAGMKVSDLEQAEDLSKNDPLKYGFKIISAIRSFIVVPASQEEKEEWLSVLNKALYELQNKMLSHAKTNNRTSIFLEPAMLDNFDAALGSLAPVWIPDDSVSMCMMCYKKFTFARRRHHCRVCGKVLCGPCSDLKAEIKYLGSKQARCCLNCYEQLTTGETGPSTPAAVDLDPISSISESVHTTDCTNNKHKRTRLKKERSLVPAHLIQAPSEVDYQMRGNLEYNESSSSKFKNSRWVLLQDTVLYIYKKREDAAAMQTVPILGYEIESISNTVFALRHKNVQDRFFRAENKESADKWKKELAKVLSGTITNLTTYSTSSLEEPLLRARSATTGMVHSTEMNRSQQTQSGDFPNKCYSDDVTSNSVDLSKLSAPVSSTNVLETETETGESEDLTETIKEQELFVESKD